MENTSTVRDWTDEDAYWRSQYHIRPYADGRPYDEFSGAYRYGFDSAHRYRGRSWTQVESDLEREWDTYRYKTKSTWQEIKDAVRDAWDRMTS